MLLHLFSNLISLFRRNHPANDRVRQWLLTDDYAQLSVNNTKEMKVSGASKLNSKQGEALMGAMSLNVEEDLGADFAEDFQDYDGALQDSMLHFPANHIYVYKADAKLHASIQ